MDEEAVRAFEESLQDLLDVHGGWGSTFTLKRVIVDL